MSRPSAPAGIAIALVAWLLLVAIGCEGSRPSAKSGPGSIGPGVSEVARPEEGRIAAGQTIYVPACSQVATADNEEPLNLAATLFVRNTDPSGSIVIVRVGYFDSAGKVVREFAPSPLQVGPMASATFFVREGDVTGGTSPCFLVDWVATEATNPPVVESVMIGTSGTQGISFTGEGRVIASRKPPG